MPVWITQILAKQKDSALLGGRRERKRDDTPLPHTWLSFFESLMLTSHGFDPLVVTEGCVDVGCCLVEEFFWHCCINIFFWNLSLQVLHKLFEVVSGEIRQSCVFAWVCVVTFDPSVYVGGRGRRLLVSQSVWHVTAAWMASLQSQTAGCVEQHQPFDSLMRLKLSAVLKRVHVRNWLVWEPTFGQIVLLKQIVV